MFRALRGRTNVSSNSVIVSLIATLAATCNVAVAQPADVTAVGRVIDLAGAPIAGARVSFEGSPRSTTTDRGGWFTLDVPLGTTLVIEHDGDEIGLAVVSGTSIDDIVLRPLE